MVIEFKVFFLFSVLLRVVFLMKFLMWPHPLKPLFLKSLRNNANNCKRTSRSSSLVRLLPRSLIPLNATKIFLSWATPLTPLRLHRPLSPKSWPQPTLPHSPNPDLPQSPQPPPPVPPLAVSVWRMHPHPKTPHASELWSMCTSQPRFTKPPRIQHSRPRSCQLSP